MRLYLTSLFVLLASVAPAQVIVQQSSQVIVAASPDDAALTSYTLDILPSAGGAAVFSRSLGKPLMSSAPCTFGTDATVMPPPCVTLPIGWSSAQFTAIVPGTYVAVVTAVAPGGSAPSVASLPFVVPAAAPFVPRPPGRPGVVR